MPVAEMAVGEVNACTTVDEGRIGPYRLAELLGSGGMGRVFLAFDEAGRPVALKQLRSRCRDEESRERFLREARLLASVEHENLVRLIECGVSEGPLADGLPYLVMDYVAGPTLVRLLGERPAGLELRELALVIGRCAAALGALHARGIVHRDVKPGNVMITPELEVKLVDLGIARRLEEEPLTRTGELLGTFDYMPPEVFEGLTWEEPGDVYALAVLACHCLPLGDVGSADDTLPNEPQLAPTPPTPGESLGPLRELIERCLNPDPHLRPAAEEVEAACAELVGALDELSELRRDVGACARRGPEAPSGAPTASGLEHVGDYVLGPELGRGGMGVVYRANQTGLERTVALKLLGGYRLERPAARARFLQEASAAARLDHPNVIRVLDLGLHDDRIYMAMELIEGLTLRQRLPEILTWDYERRLELFDRICAGVAHAHERGVIHRDLKPENIMIRAEDGEPVLLDFGVAKRTDEEDDEEGGLTQTGAILGTPRYMSPEQAAGRSREVGVRSDVYSLGAILFELICGHSPQEGSLERVLNRLRFEDAPPPSSLAPGVPWELDAICVRTLERHPANRYAGVDALRDDLRRYREGEVILARRVSTLYRLRRWASRRRSLVAGFAAGLLGLACLTGLWNERRARERQERGAQALVAFEEAHRATVAHDWSGALRACSLARANLIGASPPLVNQGGLVGVLPGAARSAESVDALEAEVQRRRQVQRALALLEQASGARAQAAEAGDQRERLEILTDAQLLLARARDLAPANEEVRGAWDELQHELGALRARARLALRAEESSRRAQALTEEGQQALAAGELERARSCFDRALGHDGSLAAARTGARAVERAATRASLVQRRAELRGKAESLATRARELVGEGALDDARDLLVQALGFSGDLEAAREGLLEVERQQAEQRVAAARREALAEASRWADLAAEEREAARVAFCQDGELGAAQQHYLRSLELLQRAALEAPKGERAAFEARRRAAAAELCAVLRDEGYDELARVVVLMNGLSAEEARAPTPRDPHLVLLEADRVRVREAYLGRAVFEPTRIFSELRGWVASQGPNLRVWLELRSRVERGGPHPRVYLDQVRVRVEDRAARVFTPAREIDLAAFSLRSGELLRPVRVLPGGRRQVRALERTLDLDVAALRERVAQVTQAMVRDAYRGGGRPRRSSPLETSRR